MTCHSDQPERACRIFHSHYSRLSGNRAVWRSKPGKLRGFAKRIRQWNLTPRPQVRFLHPRFIWAYGEIWQYAVALGAIVERRGGSSPLTPTTVMNRCCSWLNSFDHYYSQLASDGAIVLCKLGLLCDCSSIGRASDFQSECCGIVPRQSLHRYYT